MREEKEDSRKVGHKVFLVEMVDLAITIRSAIAKADKQTHEARIPMRDKGPPRRIPGSKHRHLPDTPYRDIHRYLPRLERQSRKNKSHGCDETD